jgi:hypothetical protein
MRRRNWDDDEQLDEEEELPRRQRESVRVDYERDIIREDDEWSDPYHRAVNAQRRKREGLPPGRGLHYDERQVAYMLDAIVDYRNKAEALARKLAKYVTTDRNLKVRYERFVATGGITGDDFRALIEKGAQKPPVKRRGNIRLVVSNKPKRRGSIPRRKMRTKVNKRG